MSRVCQARQVEKGLEEKISFLSSDKGRKAGPVGGCVLGEMGSLSTARKVGKCQRK